MSSFARALLITCLLLPTLAQAQPTAVASSGGTFAVAYVETRGDAAAAGRAALARYAATLRRNDSCLAVDVFEQAGRAGRFVIVESWRDAAAFDAREAVPKRELLEALQPLRISDYDERPYKALTLDTRAAAAATPGVVVVAHVDVAPNSRAPELLQELAARSRSEAGNVRFDVLQHAQRGNHFTVVEQWRSAAAVDEHVAAAHTRAYRDALQPLTGSPLDERTFMAIAAGR